MDLLLVLMSLDAGSSQEEDKPLTTGVSIRMQYCRLFIPDPTQPPPHPNHINHCIAYEKKGVSPSAHFALSAEECYHRNGSRSKLLHAFKLQLKWSCLAKGVEFYGLSLSNSLLGRGNTEHEQGGGPVPILDPPPVI